MPRTRPPARLIQTTLTYEDKSASFIWAEEEGGVGEGGSWLRDLRGGPHSLVRSHHRAFIHQSKIWPDDVMHWAAQCIDDPFKRKNAPLEINELKHLAWVGALLDSRQVIITRSPPSLTSFKLLAQGAGGVIMGAWLGYEAAQAIGTPLLTFVSVPAGMLVVGATAGIAKGLETGLDKWLVKKMTSAPKREPKPKAKRAPRKKGEGLTLEARGTVTGTGTPLALLAAAEEEAHAVKDEAKPKEDVEKKVRAKIRQDKPLFDYELKETRKSGVRVMIDKATGKILGVEKKKR